MIAKLRRRHRVFAFGLLAVPVFAWWGFSSGAPEVRTEALPESLRSVSNVDAVTWNGADTETGLAWGEVEASGSGPRAVIRATAPLRKPDVIAFWLASEPASSSEAGVPEGAVFAGRLDGARAVQLDAPARRGGLLVYSLGHQERVAWIPLGTAAGGGAQ